MQRDATGGSRNPGCEAWKRTGNHLLPPTCRAEIDRLRSSAELLDRFDHSLGRRVEITRGRTLAQASLNHTARSGLSTLRRRTRIRMDVHPVLRGTLKLRNLCFPGSDRIDQLRQDHI